MRRDRFFWRLAVEVAPRSRPRWWWVAPVADALTALVLALLLAAVMAGCGVAPPVMEACRKACEPGGVEAVEAGACRCQPVAGACTIDRLVVTPLPPGKRPATKGGG